MNLLERHNIKVFGSGKETIMFAHGYGCDQNMWRNVFPAFQDDYRINPREKSVHQVFRVRFREVSFWPHLSNLLPMKNPDFRTVGHACGMEFPF